MFKNCSTKTELPDIVSLSFDFFVLFLSKFAHFFAFSAFNFRLLFFRERVLRV